MSSKKSNKTSTDAKQHQKQSKKNNLPLIITAVCVVCVAVIAVIAGKGFGGNSELPSAADAGDSVKNAADTPDVQVIAAGEYLTIPTAEISTTASFYPVTVDGTKMEVFAIKASDGTIRTAFNTCQSCYTSGRGYYVQQGDDLVCQNCGFHFTPDQVEIQSGGCNPWPIFAENKTVTDDNIQISYEFLKASSSIFANWKR